MDSALLDEDPRHVVVAMSGGVDSAVAALLLVREGFRVTGLFMSNGVYAEGEVAGRKTCCSERDACDAEACARALGIEVYRLDFKRAFAGIVEHFANEYQQGRTPNPCIECNRRLKFGRLIAHARAIGAGAVATGHYARLDHTGGRYFLRRAADASKDQTYVLVGLEQHQLSRARFPLGGLTKPAVRRLAAEAGLPVSTKAESMDICFVPHGDYRSVLRARGVDDRPGEVVDSAGRVLGQHGGVHGFTIGQRRGLGVCAPEPRYVIRLEPAARRVVVGSRAELEGRQLTASQVSWMRCPGLAPGDRLPTWAQIRAHHAPARAVARGTDDPRGFALEFESPQEAITPGQAVCLYGDDGAVEAGGWIA